MSRSQKQRLMRLVNDYAVDGAGPLEMRLRRMRVEARHLTDAELKVHLVAAYGGLIEELNLMGLAAFYRRDIASAAGKARVAPILEASTTRSRPSRFAAIALGAGMLGIGCVGIAYASGAASTFLHGDQIEEAKERATRYMGDPPSPTFRQLSFKSASKGFAYVCGWAKDNNEFGGPEGWKPFVVKFEEDKRPRVSMPQDHLSMHRAAQCNGIWGAKEVDQDLMARTRCGPEYYDVASWLTVNLECPHLMKAIPRE